MQLKDRVILKQGSTFRDLSVNLSNYLSGTETLNVTAATDYLYLGSNLPFNNRWFEVSTANASAGLISKIEIWSGSQWNAVAEFVDMTVSGGCTLAQSGVLTWVPDKFLPTWAYSDRTALISDLAAGPAIYDLYWMKITFAANLSGSTALKFIGHKFSSDADLFNEYPEFNDTNLMSAISVGKTSWTDQTFAAAEYIIQDLKKKNFIRSKNQLLDYSIFKQASIHKVAQIIYTLRGKNYVEHADRALVAYKRALSVSEYQIDENANAIIDMNEEYAITGWMTR